MRPLIKSFFISLLKFFSKSENLCRASIPIKVLSEKLTEEEVNTIITSSDAAISWLDSNPEATLSEITSQETELQNTLLPIMKKLHGAAPGTTTEQHEDTGPEVENVD